MSVRGSGDSETDVQIASKSKELENGPEEAEFPDGGLRAWGTVFGAFVINFSCYGVITSFGVFEEYYSANQLKNQPLSTISWIGSLQLSLVLLMGCVSGPLFDAGYLKPMIASAGALYVFCLFMTSISVELYQFVLCQGLGVGIAMGMLYSPVVSTIGHYFQKRRIIAFGIFSTGASIGGTVLPIAMRRLFEEIGFAWAVRTLAFLVLLSVISGFLCCSTRLPPSKSRRVLDFSVFHDRAYCFLVLGLSLVGLGLYAPVSFGVTYAVYRGVNGDLAFYSLSILNALSLVGRLLPNFIAQRMGPINMLIVACTLSGIFDIVWAAVKSTAGILVFNAVFGLVSGGYVSVLPAAIASLGADTQDIGLRLGMAFFSASFFWLASSPVQGALINLHGTYWPAALFSGCIVLTGVAMVVVSRILVCRRTGNQWV